MYKFVLQAMIKFARQTECFSLLLSAFKFDLLRYMLYLSLLMASIKVLVALGLKF
jgi:hypothetical protein